MVVSYIKTMNKNDCPLVSVVIPVYNNILWLEEAVESVIKQDYPNIEIIVVNDGSTESFENFCEKYKDKIHYYHNKNSGVAYARNFGIEHANGYYIAFLDSDDIWCKNKISTQVKYMEHYKVKWSQHDYAYFDDASGKILKKVSTASFEGSIQHYIFTSCLIQTSCVMVEKSILNNDRKIRFDENKKYGEDNIFYLKLSDYSVGYINETLTYYRMRGGNAGQNITVQIGYRSNIYKEYHNSSIYKEHTNFCTKLGYKLCYITNRSFSGIIKKNGIGAKLVYFVPWSIFKINYYIMSIRRK